MGGAEEAQGMEGAEGMEEGGEEMEEGYDDAGMESEEMTGE
jgi:hypothetical protein